MSPASQSFRFRESRRLLREVPVRLSVSGEDGELVARTRDIAIGGMFVATSDVRPVGTGTAFVLELGSADAPDTVQGEAAVVWVREVPGGADQPAGMGMQFTRVEPPGEERLAMLFSEPPDEAAGSDAAAEAPLPAPGEPDEPEPDEPEPDEPEPEEVETEEVETVDETPDEAGEATEEPEVTAVEDEAAAPEEPATGDGEVGDTRADLFGDLAGDQDDWMNRESDRPSWVWPTVAGVILVGLLLIFLRGPLMRLVGIGGNGAEEQPAPVAQSFEVPAPVEEPPVEEPVAAVDPPAADRPLTESVPDSVAADVSDRAAPALSSEATTPSPEPTVPSPEPATPSPEPAVALPEPAARPAEPVARPRPPAPAQSSPAPSAPPANATALRAITASVQDGRTLVEIAGNAPFERHHVMLLESPPRLLVRLIGVQRDYDASAVSAPRLRGVRTGVHGRGATRNLHVVLDLEAPDIVATVERRGDRVVVHLSD